MQLDLLSVEHVRSPPEPLRIRHIADSATDAARVIGQAMVACDRLKKLLAGNNAQETSSDHDDLQAFQARLAAPSKWLVRGSDGQTP